MTNTEQMSDRELDAAVAIMLGWSDLTTKYGPLCGHHPDTEKDLRVYGHTSVPAYSTDLSAAFQLVEHLRHQQIYIGVAYKAGIFDDDFSRFGWEVDFRGVGNEGNFRVQAVAATLPRAIALASLQAVEGR